MSRNPYHVKDQSPALRRSVFVWMDILGYKEMFRRSVNSGNQQQLLDKLYCALEKGRTWLEDNDRFLEKDNYALKAFTDNIVIGWPVLDDAESEFGSAVSKLPFFQLQMVTEGFFIRGAISIDSAYVDEIAVFGSALFESYVGESSLACNPRIILTESAVQVAERHLKYYSEPRYAPHSRAVLRDSDGQWFLNYLDCLLFAEDDVGPCYEELAKHKLAVEEGLSTNKADQKLSSKFSWVAGYHDFFCDLHPHHFGNEHKIDAELFQAPTTPTRIFEV